MNFAKKALMTACLTLTAGTASAYEQLSPPSWGLDRIDQAGSVATGDGKYVYDNEAAGMPVFIIDTGVDLSHPDFEGRAILWDLLAPGSGFTDCQLGSGSAVPNHGTMVAGIVGSKTFGVAKKAKLIVVRAIDCAGQSNSTALAAAIDNIIANGPPAPNGRRGVINLSLVLTGTADQNAELENAVTRAINAGFVVVAAAGNGNGLACSNSPGKMPSVITVAASNQADARATAIASSDPALLPPQPASAVGSCVKIWAPGQNIKGPRIGDYANANPLVWGGTSFATPHVSGAAAILLSRGIAPANVLSQLQADATLGALNGATLGPGSPNTLLRIKGPTDPCLQDRPLPAGGAALNVPNPTGGKCHFYLDVPPGKTSVTFKITGGTGDADMYVRFNGKPEDYVYDCRPFRPGNEEICTMYIPTNAAWGAGGRWWVRLGGYNNGAYTTSVSGTVQ